MTEKTQGRRAPNLISGSITVVLVRLISVSFPFLNASSHMLGMFVVLSLGRYTVFSMYFTTAVFCCFPDYGGACISALVFPAARALGAALAVLTDGSYPLPLGRRTEKLASFLMC